MRKKNIWIISFSELHKDPRVHRQIQWLAPFHHVTTFGFTPSYVNGVDHVDIPPITSSDHWKDKLRSRMLTCSLMLLRQFERFYWSSSSNQQALKILENMEGTPDLIIANDIYTMPLASTVAQGTPIILDLHEYAPREWEDILRWRIFFQPYACYLTKKYLPAASATLTVCEGIANEYHKQFCVKPQVLTNASPLCDLKPSLPAENKIRMIHFGGALPSRKLEEMIYLMDLLDERFTLDFLLVPHESDYIRKLKNIAAKNPKITFLPPVSMQELPYFSNRYDIGLYHLPPVNFNHLYALPNKFFEFIQARLAIAISPSPEMARYVREFECGIIADTFDITSFAPKLQGLDAKQILFYKNNSHRAAEELNAENNASLLLQMVEQTSLR